MKQLQSVTQWESGGEEEGGGVFMNEVRGEGEERGSSLGAVHYYVGVSLKGFLGAYKVWVWTQTWVI